MVSVMFVSTMDIDSAVLLSNNEIFLNVSDCH